MICLPASQVVDFSLAQEWPLREGMTGPVCSRAYRPPEIGSGVSLSQLSKLVGPWSDLWSLGRVVYEALTGRPLVADKADTRNYLRYKGSCFSHRVRFLDKQWWGVVEVLLAASGPERGLPLANPFEWAENLGLFTQ